MLLLIFATGAMVCRRRWRMMMNEFETVTIHEVCEQFQISVRTVYDWVKRDGFPQPITRGHGKTRRWLKSDIREWVNARKSAA
jgi:excisionase family DNA binding protein